MSQEENCFDAGIKACDCKKASTFYPCNFWIGKAYPDLK